MKDKLQLFPRQKYTLDHPYPESFREKYCEDRMIDTDLKGPEV